MRAHNSKYTLAQGHDEHMEPQHLHSHRPVDRFINRLSLQVQGGGGCRPRARTIAGPVGHSGMFMRSRVDTDDGLSLWKEVPLQIGRVGA